MSTIGTVESLWRYPVKSMRGEELDEMYAGYAGVYGDRIFAFGSTGSRKGFPYLTGREQRAMLQYRPRFRQSEKAARPLNQADAESLPPGATPRYASPDELMVEVVTPDGTAVPIDDPALMDVLRKGIDDTHQLSLLRSDRSFTDCRPLSIFAVQSARRLSEETGVNVDKRRFRANVYLDLPSSEGFAEDQFVGRTLRIGPDVVVAILERDPRCMMITLDPETGEKEPAILKAVAQGHQGMAGIYGAILAQGTIHKGDPVELL